MRHGLAGGLVAVALSLVLTGCASGPIVDPMRVMLDRSRDPAKRLAAAHQLGSIAESPDPDTLAKTFGRLVWLDNQPAELRLLAMDRLIEYDAQAFWQTAAIRLRTINQWPVREPIIQWAAERGDPAFIPALVRSYVKPSSVYPDDQRPERAAILALAPDKTIEQAVWDVFASSDERISTTERVDAWELVNRLADPQQIRADLLKLETRVPLILDLQSASWLGVLPDRRESVLWLMRIRAEGGGAFWEDAKAKAALLTGPQRQGLALRHLAALLAADAHELRLSRGDLLSRVATRLSSVDRTKRELAGNMLELPSERFSAHAGQLCWADLLVLSRLIGALGERDLINELFRQADADHDDTSTEHGGVISLTDATCRAVSFPPVLRAHDQAFYSSDALIKQLYTGLAHYHFHAHEHKNAVYAGPGPGDLLFVEHMQASAVVFTFLDQDTLGVDYYQPGKIVLDLGTLKR